MVEYYVTKKLLRIFGISSLWENGNSVLMIDFQFNTDEPGKLEVIYSKNCDIALVKISSGSWLSRKLDLLASVIPQGNGTILCTELEANELILAIDLYGSIKEYTIEREYKSDKVVRTRLSFKELDDWITRKVERC